VRKGVRGRVPWREGVCTGLTPMSRASTPGAELSAVEQVAALQRQGRSAEAAERCDLLLSEAADDWRLRLLRGLARRQLGQTAAAIEDFRAVTQAAPSQVEAWLQLAGTLFDAGDGQGASQAGVDALRVAGGDAGLCFRIGSVLEQCADPVAASAAYEAALQADPAHVEALNNLASLERARGELLRAQGRLEQAIGLRPDFAPAYLNLASVLDARALGPEARMRVLKQGVSACSGSTALAFELGLACLRIPDLQGAERLFSRVLASDPLRFDALNNLGTIRLQVGDLLAARQLFERALAIDPSHAPARSNLGSTLLLLGQPAEAALAYAAAAEADPLLVDAWVGSGAALLELGHVEAAQQCYAQALAIRPDSVEALAGAGNLLAQAGEVDRARAFYEAACTLAPSPALEVRRALLLSPVHASADALDEERRRFEAEVDRLLACADEITEADLLRYPDTWFYLAYHGRNDREVRQRLAALLLGRCPSLAHVALHALSARQPGRPLRVGFAGRFFHSHSVGRFFNPVIEALANDPRFEVVVFRLDPRRDERIEQLERAPLQSAVISSWSLPEARSAIEARALDVLVYPEIGMDPFTYLLSFSRLARVQCVLHGHSVTTGVPSIDWFVSSGLIEPPDAQAQFSERLALLPTLPMVLQPLGALPAPLDREGLGVPAGSCLYLCPMKLQKVHPEMDAAVAGILRSDPAARVAFVRDATHPNWHAIVSRRMQAAMPDVFDRVVFVPWMNEQEAFIGLVRAADVILDSFHHGGATTSHLCLASGRAVVAWRSGSSRAGFIEGYYRLLDVSGCLADTPAEYVRIAVRLGKDAVLRKGVEAAIGKGLSRLHQAADVCAAYAGFLLEVGAAAPAASCGEQYRQMYTALDWSVHAGGLHEVVEPARSVSVWPPRVAGTPAVEPAERVELPPVYFALLEDVLVIGGESCVLPGGGEAVIDEVGARDAAGRTRLDNVAYAARAGARVALRPPRAPARSLDEAIWLCGRASGNYYHWLTEYLPRLATLAHCGTRAGWPVLIDAGLHPNLLAALRRCLSPGQALVEVAAGERVRVSRLLVLGPRAWMPIDLRPGVAAGAEDILFSPDVARFVRQRLGVDTVRTACRRLFLRRGSASHRSLLNEAEIERAMVARGFEVVCPESLSLDQQVALFAEASIVVGATGAAFVNIMLAPPGCRALVFYYAGAPMQYMSSLAQVLDVDLRYVHGEPVDGSYPVAYQRDFTVDLAAVERGLDELVAGTPRWRQGGAA